MNPWNQLAQYFDTNVAPDEINPGAADNILLAWPLMLAEIKEYFQNDFANKTALDVGCGAGSFSGKLKELGFGTILGIDPSEEMVANAKKSGLEDGNLTFQIASHFDIPKFDRHDLITSVMVFQFVSGLDELAKLISEGLKEGGLLTFTVFNPAFIRNNSRGGFNLFSSEEKVKGFPTYNMNIGTTEPIPVYLRDCQEYTAAFERNGFTLRKEYYPPFTAEFLNKYPKPGDDTSAPEYMILSFSKN